jgi:DNA-binding response OmpR family regulator
MSGRILSISYDDTLLKTRELVLKLDGYDVTSAFGYVQSVAACDGSYDLVIMGHSIPQSDKRAIVAELRKRGSDAPVLSLLRHGEHPIPEAAQAIDPDPQHLLDTVESMLAKRHAERA